MNQFNDLEKKYNELQAKVTTIRTSNDSTVLNNYKTELEALLNNLKAYKSGPSKPEAIKLVEKQKQPEYIKQVEALIQLVKSKIDLSNVLSRNTTEIANKDLFIQTKVQFDEIANKLKAAKPFTLNPNEKKLIDDINVKINDATKMIAQNVPIPIVGGKRKYKGSHKSSRKLSRKLSHKLSHKLSRKGIHKQTSKKLSKKISHKVVKKTHKDGKKGSTKKTKKLSIK